MNTGPNLLRVVMCGLRCSLPLATVLSGVLYDIHIHFYRKKR